MQTVWLWVPTLESGAKGHPSGSHPGGTRPLDTRPRVIAIGSAPLAPGRVYELARVSSRKEAHATLLLALAHDPKASPPEGAAALAAWGEARAAHARVKFIGEWARSTVPSRPGLVQVPGKVS